MRSGTENVPGIAGFAAAFKDREDIEKVRKLKDHLTDRLLSEAEGVSVNGSRENSLPGTVNLSFEHVRGESILMRLSSLGIYVSTGSACTSGSGELSHVLKAMGYTDERCNSSLRFSLSGENTKEEIDETVEALKDIVSDFRKILA